MDNEARKPLSDMTVQVSIETGKASKALTIPMVALGERGGRLLRRDRARRQATNRSAAPSRPACRTAPACRVLDGLAGRREGLAGAALGGQMPLRLRPLPPLQRASDAAAD